MQGGYPSIPSSSPSFSYASSPPSSAPYGFHPNMMVCICHIQSCVHICMCIIIYTVSSTIIYMLSQTNDIYTSHVCSQMHIFLDLEEI